MSGARQGRYARRNGEPWTPEEDLVLRTAMGEYRALGARLGRTTNAVADRVRLLRRRRAQAVPPYSAGAVRLVGQWGITVGPGSTIRCWTVLEKPTDQLLLEDVL